LQRLLSQPALAIDAVVFQILPNNDFRDNWEDGGFGLENGALVAYESPHIPARVCWRDTLLDNSLARNSRVVTLLANASFNGVGMDPHLDAMAMELEHQLLRAVAATAAVHHVPVVFLLVATAWEHDRVSTAPFDERARLDFVASVLRDSGVPWIDTRRDVNAPEHYIPNDGHFSALGHAVVGRMLAGVLVDWLNSH